jgi:hypothetical protein
MSFISNDGKQASNYITLVDFQLQNCSSFLTGAQDRHLQRVTIPEATYIQLRRRPPEDKEGNARNM